MNIALIAVSALPKMLTGLFGLRCDQHILLQRAWRRFLVWTFC